MKTGQRRPALRAAAERARLLRRNRAVEPTLSAITITPPRWSRVTSAEGALRPAYSATITWPASSRRLSSPTKERARRSSHRVGPQPGAAGAVFARRVISLLTAET